MQVKKRLIFIRHGQTDENLSDRLHIHQLLEVGLNAEGQKQIQLATKVCRENNVDMVFCSPEVRAIESAKIIADNLEVSPPTILPELLERNWGEWEGKPWEEVEKMLDAMPLSKRYTFPPQGESWQQMEMRLQKALAIIMASTATVAAIVTHGGALRAIIPVLTNLPLESSFGHQFHNGSITIFDYDNGKYHQVKVNDTSHL